jgi:hypothetical protein
MAMSGPSGPLPEDAQALLDYYDKELRPRRMYIRRNDRVFAVMYGFTIAVNAMGVVVVDEWWRWLCLAVVVGLGLAFRSHLHKMRAEADEWRGFEEQTEAFRRKVRGEE